jgi:tetratricopeptide (TPR) repeat protein
MVQNMIAAEQPADAERLARTYLTAHPGCGPMYDVLHAHLLKSGRTAEAESLLESKIAADRSNPLYVVQLAEHHWRLNQLDRMKTVLRRLEGNASSMPGAYLEAGDFYARIRDWDSAIRAYQLGAATEGNAKEPEYLKRIAASQLAQGDTQGARLTLERLLARFPSDTDAIASRASLRLATGKKEEITRAVSDLEQAVKREPEDPRLRFDLARAYLQTQRASEAAQHLHQVLKRHPQHLGALRELAAYHLQRHEIGKADEFAARILELDPADAGARLIGTAALASQNRHGEARSELKRLLARHPGLAEAQLQLAMLSLAEKNYTEAERSFLALLKKHPGDLRALKGLTEVHFSKNRPEAAVEAVEKQVGAQPNSSALLKLFAGTAHRAGRLQTAARAYQRLAVLAPDEPQAWLDLSTLHHEMHDFEQAAAAARKALAIDPNRAQGWSLLAAAHAGMGQPGEAVASYRRAVALEPSNAAHLNNLAYYLLETRTAPAEALSLARQASQRLPGDPRVADTLGLAYLETGQTASALEVFRTVVQKNHRDPVYRLHLAEALLAAGDQAGARRELEAALELNPKGGVESRIRSLLQRR